jgi:hypothetical protein
VPASFPDPTRAGGSPDETARTFAYGESRGRWCSIPSNPEKGALDAHRKLRARFAADVFAAGLASPVFSQLPGTPSEKAFPKPPYSPYAGRSYPTRPYFGDTHVHTALSMDAGAFGARLTPRDAYRFARGEEITASSNQPVKLSRPLDFLVVADHSDNMGFFPDLFAGKREVPEGVRMTVTERAYTSPEWYSPN